jgi:hypothetical protein
MAATVINFENRKKQYFTRDDVRGNAAVEKPYFYIDVTRFGLNKRIIGDTPYDVVNSANLFLSGQLDNQRKFG